MFMEAKSLWVMLVARFLQGISSSTVWVIGLALMYAPPTLVLPPNLQYLTSRHHRCDTTPEDKAGREPNLSPTGFIS